MAMPEEGKKCVVRLNKWVKLSLYDVSGLWTSKTVRTIIAPSLCAPVILGLHFLEHNNIVIDHATCTVIDKTCSFDLLDEAEISPGINAVLSVATDESVLNSIQSGYVDDEFCK